MPFFSLFFYYGEIGGEEDSSQYHFIWASDEYGESVNRISHGVKKYNGNEFGEPVNKRLFNGFLETTAPPSHKPPSFCRQTTSEEVMVELLVFPKASESFSPPEFLIKDELDFTMQITLLAEGANTWISITLKCLWDTYQGFFLENKRTYKKPRNFLKDSHKEKLIEV